MIRNVILKKMIKNVVFPIITLLNKIVKKDDSIVLLYISNMGIRHSLLPLRQYSLDNHFNERYKIYCGIEHLKYAEDEPRVTFISGGKTLLVFLRAKHVFYTAGQLPVKPASSQIVIHMDHGNANFKTMGALTNINNGDEFYFTYMIAPSEYYVPIMAKEYRCEASNIKICGDPMTDALLKSGRNTYDFHQYDKMLLWMPTFRQSDYLSYNDSKLDSLPLFKETDCLELNERLKKYNIKLIVKLHPAQKEFGYNMQCFSHLSIFSHKEFLKENYDLALLTAQSDGLIGDYSSASLQYLLLDRPMAFVVPDIEEYDKMRGFVFENPEDYMGGHIIKSKDDFWQFLDDFAVGKDIYKEKRHRITDIIYKFKDANSCKRIVELSEMTV